MSAQLEAFPPGDFLCEEIEARDWNQQKLADMTGFPVETIQQIILSKHPITPEVYKAFAQAFGTSAEYWENLEAQYRQKQPVSHQ